MFQISKPGKNYAGVTFICNYTTSTPEQNVTHEFKVKNSRPIIIPFPGRLAVCCPRSAAAVRTCPEIIRTSAVRMAVRTSAVRMAVRTNLSTQAQMSVESTQPSPGRAQLRRRGFMSTRVCHHEGCFIESILDRGFRVPTSVQGDGY